MTFRWLIVAGCVCLLAVPESVRSRLGAIVCPPTPRVSAARADPIYLPCQVERVARLAPANPAPLYPPLLAGAAVGGVVRTQFVVDKLGRVDTNSVRVYWSTHDLFTAAVSRVLPRWRATPAMLHAVSVRQLVLHDFDFLPLNDSTPCPSKTFLDEGVTFICGGVRRQ